jgi:hypothetical protein
MNQPLTFGTSYYPDHWPENEWERDLKLIKDSGISAVRFGEFSWTWVSPKPGVYDFKQYDRFMDLANRCEIQVMLCTPTCNAPKWFFAQYPDTRQLDQFDRPHIGHRHMACYNHPQALLAAEEIVSRLADHYKDHPALVAWQIDNELTAGESADLHKLYDYHPNTLAHFRDYLKLKYESIDDLNKKFWNNFWSNCYTDWEEIDPPRPGLSGQINPSLWLEWSRFRTKNLAEFGRKQAAWLRAIKADFLIGTNVPEVSPLKGALLGQDYWELCKDMDFIGTDIYVYSGDDICDQQRIACSCDVIRSAASASNATFGILETQAGPHLRPWRTTFTGGDWTIDFLEQSVNTYIKHGAEYIYFFLWRPTQGGAEFGMNGLVNTDGTPSERSNELPRIFSEASKIMNTNSKPTAYIHYSNDTIQLLSLYDPDRTGDTAILGCHTLLEDLGFQVVFLNDDALNNLEEYPQGVVFLAQSLVLNHDLCKRLANTRHSLVGVGAPGYFDENANIYPILPGDILGKRFGLRIEAFEANKPMAHQSEWIDDFPLLHTRVKVTTGKLQYLDESERPLLVLSPNSLYINFDVGSLYKRLPLTKRDLLRNVLKPYFSQL